MKQDEKSQALALHDYSLCLLSRTSIAVLERWLSLMLLFAVLAQT